MDGVKLSPLKQIINPKGNILHAMKASDNGFAGFGEAYFSTVNQGQIKGWKKHFEMTLNLVVITGKIEFVIYNGDSFYSVKLSKTNYQRLTLGPGLWFAFRGLSSENIVLNLASIEHKIEESTSVELYEFDYDWNKS